MVNGKDLQNGNEEIDLAVEIDVNTVPEDKVRRLADGAPEKQIYLTHNGKIGFIATLRIHVGADYTGKYGNLFWYASEGKFIYINYR